MCVAVIGTSKGAHYFIKVESHCFTICTVYIFSAGFIKIFKKLKIYSQRIFTNYIILNSVQRLKKLHFADENSWRSTDHRSQSNHSIQLVYQCDDRRIWDCCELSCNITEFSTAGMRIIITSVLGILDNSTVIKDRLPLFVASTYLLGIYSQSSSLLHRTNAVWKCACGASCYQRLCGLMHVSNSSARLLQSHERSHLLIKVKIFRKKFQEKISCIEFWIFKIGIKCCFLKLKNN